MVSGAQWTGSAAKRENRRFAVRAGGSRVSDEHMYEYYRFVIPLCRMVM